MKKLLVLLTGFCLFTAMTCEKKTEEISIHESVRKNDTRAVKKYLENGGDPNFSTPERGSLLFESLGPKGGFKVMKLLVENGADVNLGSGKYTSLMNAARWINLKAVKFLLETGADSKLKNESGETALEAVGQCNCPAEEEVKKLLSF